MNPPETSTVIAPRARIVLTSSTSEAYAFLFKLLCNPGDVILVPRPSYPLFEYLGRLESVEVGGYPLAYEGSWHLEPSAVAEAMTSRVRAVVLVSPNNPTGSYVKREEADRLLEECARAGLLAETEAKLDARSVTVRRPGQAPIAVPNSARVTLQAATLEAKGGAVVWVDCAAGAELIGFGVRILQEGDNPGLGECVRLEGPSK